MTAGRLLTRGHSAAVAAVRGMIEGEPPHALLLSGPTAIGKTTLALDLAAGLLCLAEDPRTRPCRECRACRQVVSGNHPDLHRLAPDGPGGQVGIGQVRALATELALLPIESARRIAVVESAHRMNEDAQNALLKTLEEPPPGTTIILCVDDEDRLLPTVRSRCARLRLGPVGTRDIERVLDERGIADPPTGGRLARLASGRPGLAIALGAAPEAIAVRSEISRQLVDLLGARPAARLAAIRDLLARAAELSRLIDSKTGPRPAAASDRSADAPADGESPEAEAGAVAEVRAGSEARAPAAERRRALALLLDVWRDLGRDLALVRHGDLRRLHDSSLIEELQAASAALSGTAVVVFLARLDRAGEQLEANVSPELLADSLILAWPRASAAA
jgi:DNA polymerase-3 subunit delta'